MNEWEIIQGDWMKKFDDYRKGISKKFLKFLKL